MAFKDLTLMQRLEHIGLGNYYAEDIDEAIARIRELEAALAEAHLQRDSWKRIAESGLGLTAETGANPSGCICLYLHKSDPMCTYEPDRGEKR